MDVCDVISNKNVTEILKSSVKHMKKMGLHPFPCADIFLNVCRMETSIHCNDKFLSSSKHIHISLAIQRWHIVCVHYVLNNSSNTTRMVSVCSQTVCFSIAILNSILLLSEGCKGTLPRVFWTFQEAAAYVSNEQLHKIEYSHFLNKITTVWKQCAKFRSQVGLEIENRLQISKDSIRHACKRSQNFLQ